MTNAGVIADTSVLIDFLKHSDSADRRVLTLLEEKRLYITGIIAAELIQGLKGAKEEQLLSLLLEGVATLEIPNALWTKAGLLSASLRKQGITLPLTDIAIAVLAIEHHLPIFTLDRHFEDIPGVRLYKTP